MSYRIIPTKEFVKDSKNVDTVSLERIKKKMEEVALDPERYKHLSPPLNKYCRIRIGKLRILFSYDIKRKELYPEKIIFKHRY